MKKLKVSLLFIGVTLIFNACGSSSLKGDYSENIVKEYGQNERMIKNKEYIINKNDEIEKISPAPKIEIKNDLEKNITTAKLISGEAAIIRH